MSNTNKRLIKVRGGPGILNMRGLEAEPPAIGDILNFLIKMKSFVFQIKKNEAF